MKNINRKSRFAYKTIGGALIAAAVSLTGCQQSSPQPIGEEIYKGAPDPSDVTRLAHTQACNGAAEDAMLRSYHFDGSNLNSLGQEKLDLMLRDNEKALPLIVYLDLPANADPAVVQGEQNSVRGYLRDRGLNDRQITCKIGQNEATAFSAADGLTAQSSFGASGAPAPSGYSGGSSAAPGAAPAGAPAMGGH